MQMTTFIGIDQALHCSIGAVGAINGADIGGRVRKEFEDEAEPLRSMLRKTRSAGSYMRSHGRERFGRELAG